MSHRRTGKTRHLGQPAESGRAWEKEGSLKIGSYSGCFWMENEFMGLESRYKISKSVQREEQRDGAGTAKCLLTPVSSLSQYRIVVKKQPPRRGRLFPAFSYLGRAVGLTLTSGVGPGERHVTSMPKGFRNRWAFCTLQN